VSKVVRLDGLELLTKEQNKKSAKREKEKGAQERAAKAEAGNQLHCPRGQALRANLAGRWFGFFRV
jgi:hypothetical protein